MQTLLAAIPIVLILVLMVGYRWGAARAGSAGYISAFLIALIFFGANTEVFTYAHTRALLLSLDVLLIVWSAFLLFQVADEAGAIKVIGNALPYLTRDRGMQAILIGWVFASFLQGAGGFGVPVAVTAPLLVGLGFNPIAAVVIPSIGHGWAVNFGSLGSAFNALLSATNLNSADLAPVAAIFLVFASLLTGLLVSHSADGWQGVRRLFLKSLIIGLVMGLTQYVLAVLGLWNIAAFGGGLAGLIASFPLAKWKNGNEPTNNELKITTKPILIALSAYIVLILLTVVILLVPEIKRLFDQVVIQYSFPETITDLGYITQAGTNRPIRIFSHAGAILIYTSLISYAIYKRAGKYQAGSAQRILKKTFSSVLSSSLSIIEMVGMAMIMQLSGMTESIALGLASSLGVVYPIISPWIGALGAIMTGSNTNSNVIFASLQMRTAQLLSYSLPIIMAAQTVGAGLASVLAPTKVVVGASTAGMEGREGEIMRSLILYIGILLISISGLVAIGIWILD
ncbi:L-lactate permease [Chloroflexota bacterium]